MSMKKTNYTIGNRTRDLPACSAVPQPTGTITEQKTNPPTKNKNFDKIIT
jgi:hypothetical protein